MGALITDVVVTGNFRLSVDGKSPWKRETTTFVIQSGRQTNTLERKFYYWCPWSVTLNSTKEGSRSSHISLQSVPPKSFAYYPRSIHRMRILPLSFTSFRERYGTFRDAKTYKCQNSVLFVSLRSQLPHASFRSHLPHTDTMSPELDTNRMRAPSQKAKSQPQASVDHRKRYDLATFT